jgi:hypothetical protein
VGYGRHYDLPQLRRGPFLIGESSADPPAAVARLPYYLATVAWGASDLVDRANETRTWIGIVLLERNQCYPRLKLWLSALAQTSHFRLQHVPSACCGGS